MNAERWTTPLVAQIVALVVVSVLVAQIVNIIVVLTSPPPVRPQFSVEDAAEVLADRASAELSQRFSVAIAPGGPADNFEDPEEAEARVALARLIPANAQDIRVVMRAGPAPPGLARDANPQPAPPRGINLFGLPAAQTPVQAALKLGDGSWRIASLRNDALLQPWQQRALLWFLGTVLIVVPMGYVFARRLVAPIHKFAEAAERLGRDPLAENLTLRGPAEVGTAARAFNQMQERLRRYVEDRTRMIGAIAHDLRTPLMRLAFRLEAAPDELRKKAAKDIQEMDEMIAATLAFVRDATREPVRERLELRSLVESVADNAADMGADVAIEPGERLVLSGDRVGLRELVTNLVENAVKYGKRAGGRLYQEADCAVIEIDDEGPGLTDSELVQVFEPFYRGETSRNRETGGIGLGLAVVRGVARAHGGDVVLTNLPERGLRARVTLPIETRPASA